MNDTAKHDVLIETEGGVGVAILNRPDKFNCVSTGIVSGLIGALERFEADPAIRVMLIRANGKQFCTGADLDEVTAARQSEGDFQAFLSRGHAMLRRLEASRMPVVAAVHGLALAGGLELMMSCDVVLAAKSARFGDQHVQYGLLPGWGGTQRLPRLVGLRRAMELMYSGRWLDAEEARDWGLVNEIAEDAALVETAMEFCRTLASRNPEGLGWMKRLARDGLEGSLDAGLTLEEENAAKAQLTENTSEGLAAFKERRVPVFK
ncbi:MAG: enoyl-CoA hydratase/isomerase family protein [Alphaproteobacteria bacterium]|jgi:enoyl-CoA hydratase|nr:enoyl-CoA hydratase [Rhodospirillaceae bacterium]MDP6405030.1 enoyl-CoA hydratase/isomerase family protein [Alphaproteobacteria bacterium]MDP6623925.1 enoyl-CoA hydratase/isomerase family protein [Alphaproteobacteria bacterium]|tara:strand:+ start:1238 stop:2026 length:789 start_codon:yes stop_codon:yes gene_type:complete